MRFFLTICVLLIASWMTTVASGQSQRKAEWLRYRNAAAAIVAKTGHPEAKEVLAFLDQNAVVSEPIAGGRVDYFIPSGVKHPVITVPLLTTDTKIPGMTPIMRAYQGNGQNRTMGNYVPQTRTLVLGCFQDCSDYMRGVLLLHEGRHAWFISTQARPGMKDGPYEELATREFIWRLHVKALPHYPAALEAEVQRQRTVLLQRMKPLGSEIPPNPGYHKGLDKVFGTSLSPSEQIAFAHDLFLHAWMTLLDRDYRGANLRELKAEAISLLAGLR